MLEPLKKEAIGSDFASKLTTQEYGRKLTIAGVELRSLNVFVDDGGALAEIARFNESGNLEGLPQFKIRQSNFSQVLPGAVKAFHLHYNQEDIWFVHPFDRLLVGLVDCRKDSRTYNLSQRLVMGAGRAQVLYIPRGVAHGMCNLWETPVNMIYFVNQHFDPNNPDEHRLPWDLVGPDFWQISKG